MSGRKSLSKEKNEHLYNLYYNAFEFFKKNVSRKEKKLDILKKHCEQLKEPNKYFNSIENIRIFSLFFIEPYEICTNKVMDVILETFEEIINNKLLPAYIIQEMSQNLLIYILRYFSENEIDFNVYNKILNICVLIYTNDDLFIHNENLWNILKICLRIYLTTRNKERVQGSAQKTITIILNKILSQIIPINCEKQNAFNSSFYENININQSAQIDEKKQILMSLQLNEYKFICDKYINFLIDLLEIKENLLKQENNINEKNNSTEDIDSHEENKNNTQKIEEQKKTQNDNISILQSYISIIQSNSPSSYSNLKSLLLSLNLHKISFFSSEIKLGKFGLCVLCRSTADMFSEKLGFPICSVQCEEEFLCHMKNACARNDFLSIMIYIVLTSTLVDNNAKAKSSEENFYARVFCFEIMKEMIDKGGYIFKEDKDVVFIIKGFFKDSLLKNTLSNDVHTFQVSLELFLSIIKSFREHLKEQIEVFFMQVLITILESENLQYSFKNSILDILIKLANDCSFLVELYVNYDCDVNCSAVFSELINLLTKIMNGLYKKQKYQNILKPIEENRLINKTFDFLNKFIKNLGELVVKNEMNNQAQQNQEEKSEINQSEKSQLSTEIKDDSNIQTSTSSSTLSQIKEEKEDKITKNLKIKKMLEKAIEIFNIGKSSDNCLKFLKNEKMIFSENAFIKIKDSYINDLNNNKIGENYEKILSSEENTIISEMTAEDLSIFDTSKKINIMQTPFISNINTLVYYITNEENNILPDLTYEDYTAFEMTRFIRSNLNNLLRERVGDYLCSGKPFNIKVLTNFINSFDFKGMNILEALRVLFYELPLAGEAQVIDRVVQKFGEKFHKQNPNELGNPDFAYYLSFSLLQLNTDLHREEVEKKMTLKEFIDQLNLSTGNQKINPSYLEKLYNTISTDPLLIPGQKLGKSHKNKEIILQKERENIMKSSVKKLMNNTAIINNYLTDISNRNIKHLLEFSWSNFLSIYSQLLAETDSERVVYACIENILTTAKTCGILRLNLAEEAYINCLINMTNLNEGREIENKNMICIQNIISFVATNGQYIRTGWMSILGLISKLNYYLTSNKETIYSDLKENKKVKNIEKELNISLMKKDILTEKIIDSQLDGIFGQTNKFDEETIINFVNNLCIISKNELTSYFSPCVYCLRKLSEVAGFNLSRIQVEWVKIWKLIGEHLIYVISNSSGDNIWKEALESLKQIICKLLEKKDLSIYNFQMDFFKPFELIFEQTWQTPNRGEMILNYLYYIIGTYSKNIHSGWIVIFKIFKNGLKRRDTKMNEEIKKTIEKISEDNTIFKNFNLEVFKGYIECLCFMYIDKTMKMCAFNSIKDVVGKIIRSFSEKEENIKEKEDKNTKKDIILSLDSSTAKKYDFIKAFFYGLDDLIKVNSTEHLNLLFQIVTDNKYILFSKQASSFLYTYYIYFYPHIVSILINKNINRLELFEDIKDENIKFYDLFEFKKNDFETKCRNIKAFLNKKIEDLICKLKDNKNNNNDYIFFISEENITKNEKNKNAILTFLNQIKDNYNSIEFNNIIKKKLKDIEELEDKNYELCIEIFLDKFKSSLSKFSESPSHLIFSYFYEDLFLTLYKLLLVNEHSEALFRVIVKSLIGKKNGGTKFSNIVIERINRQNEGIMELLTHISSSLPSSHLQSLLNFSSSFFGFLLAFLPPYELKANVDFKKLSKFFVWVLRADLEEKFSKFKIVGSAVTVNAMFKIQGIESFILQKYKTIEELKNIYNSNITESIKLLYEIYMKYNMQDENNNQIIGIINTEISQITQKFIILFNTNCLKNTFKYMLDFIDSININLRNSSKKLLEIYMQENLFIFKGNNK